VTRRGYDDDRTIAVEIVTPLEAEVRTAYAGGAGSGEAA
jgi:hypothetical protein